jgi:hypothetical protein
MKTFPSPDITADRIRGVLAARIEGSMPDEVLAVLKEYDGKPLTKRLLAKLPGGEAVWRIVHSAGMTNLETLIYIRTSGGAGYSILLAHDVKNVVVNVKFIVERNPAYYDARVKRNWTREDVLANRELLTKMADTMNAVLRARAALAEVEAELEKLVEYGGPFAPDRYVWEELVGLPKD